MTVLSVASSSSGSKRKGKGKGKGKSKAAAAKRPRGGGGVGGLDSDVDDEEEGESEGEVVVEGARSLVLPSPYPVCVYVCVGDSSHHLLGRSTGLSHPRCIHTQNHAGGAPPGLRAGGGTRPGAGYLCWLRVDDDDAPGCHLTCIHAHTLGTITKQGRPSPPRCA